MSEPFTGAEASILAFLAQWPAHIEVLDMLSGRALKVGRALLGLDPIDDDVREAVSFLKSWSQKVANGNP